jgi:hypothetical protein
MVSRFLVISACVLLASCAANDCSPGSEFEPSLCALDLPQISRFEIHSNATRSKSDLAARCDDFLLSDAVLHMYFSAARQADSAEVHHTLDWSPCSASGEVFFSDGRIGQWTISQSRVGSLVINGDDAITLYCPRCAFLPFK